MNKKILCYVSDDIHAHLMQIASRKRSAVVRSSLKRLLAYKNATRYINFQAQLNNNRKFLLEMSSELHQQMTHFKENAYKTKKISYCRIVDSALRHALINNEL